LTDFILESAGLRLTLVRRGDRFVHQFTRIVGDGAHVVLESVESWGDGVEILTGTNLASNSAELQERWPPSPAIQDAHLEHRDGESPQILAVGRAGRSHWSMVLAAVSNGFLCDVACRVHETPLWLGNCYRGTVRATETLAPLAIRPGDESTDVGAAGMTWTVRPRQILGQLPATIRWQYRVEFVGG